MGGPRTKPAQVETFWAHRAQGFSIRESSKLAGISEWKGKQLASGGGTPRNGNAYREAANEAKLVAPIPLDEICAEAKAALEDRTGRLFAKRYFGIEFDPFQAEFFELLEDKWDTDEREFVLANAPPGLGKSKVFVVFAAKRTVINRAIRGLFISRAKSLAERLTLELRRALARTAPAHNADATLAGDFGRFKPQQAGEVWKRDEFVVEQMDGSPIEGKEPTWSAFGFDSEWLGNRLDIVLGDDLDNTRSIKNIDVVEVNREIFDNELEARLDGPLLPTFEDPDRLAGGLFALAQQRLGPFDFSAHCKAKVILPDDLEGTGEDVEGEPQYDVRIWKAHYEVHPDTGEQLCQGTETHKHGAPAFPEGCLLSPRRLPWRDVRKAMANARRFAVVYQQEEADESEVLVKKVWVDGGRGEDGITYHGCWDNDRGLWELPRRQDGTIALEGKLLGVITADPSPTKYWAVQAWVLHPASGRRYLLDLYRGKLEAPEFLDWSDDLGDFTGMADDWWHNFQRLGVPLSTLIVERNAAQIFLFQFSHFKRWQQARRVKVMQHSTHQQKNSQDYGLPILKDVYSNALCRLPGKQAIRYVPLKLVHEVETHPHGTTDDQVLAQWFLEHNYEDIVKPILNPPKRGVSADPRRAGWMRPGMAA